MTEGGKIEEVLPRTPRCPKCGLAEIQDHVCGSSVAEVRRKVSYLNVVQFHRLEHACRIVVDGLGHPPYLVGSSTERPDYRDVDLRSILPDDEFDALFGGRVEFWSLFCLGVGTYLSEVSGLPIDYQVQRQTQANEKYPGKERNPMGHGFRNYAGGGDATGVN